MKFRESDFIFEYEYAFGHKPTQKELDYACRNMDIRLSAEDKKRDQYLIDATWYAHIFDKELSYEQWLRVYNKK